MNIQVIIYIIGLMITFIAILVASYFIIKAIKQNKLEPKIIELITEAEGLYQSGQGSLKFEYVFDKLYNVFAPKMIRVLFSADEIKKIIQYVFDKVKIALDYQQNK